MEWLADTFTWILLSSFTGSILGIGIILVKAIFKSKISPRVYYILWLIVFVKLVAGPFVPASKLSIFNYVSYEKLAVNDAKLHKDIFNYPTNREGNIFESNNIISTSLDGKDTAYGAANNISKAEKIISSAEPAHRVFEVKKVIMSILSFSWMIGVCIMVCAVIRSACLFSKRLRGLEKLEDEMLLEVVRASIQRFKIKSKVRVFTSLHVSSPCILGIFSPRIFMPSQDSSTTKRNEMTHIIMHELAHFKRKDNLTNLLVIMGLILHWFNPIIWYIVSHMRLDRELACDAYVLEKLGEAEAVSYGMTLIKSIQLIVGKQQKGGILNFCETKTQIERRIKMLKKFKNGRYRLSVAAIVICLVISVITLTNAVTPPEEVKTNAVSNKIPEKNNAPAESKILNPNDTSSNEKIKFKIDTQSQKSFNNLERLKVFIDFDFKVPDFIPYGYKFDRILFDKREEIIFIDFSKEPRNDSSCIYKVSKANLLEKEVSSEYESCQKEPFSIGGIAGTLVTEKPKGYKGEEKKIVNYTYKSFIWKDEGLWYSIGFYSMQKGTVLLDIPIEDLTKIVQSTAKTSDVKNVTYVLPDDQGLNIYDETDLEKAEKMLGFKTKFPLSLTGGYNLFAATAAGAIQSNYIDATPNSLTVDYLSQKIKGKAKLTEFFRNLIIFRQTNDISKYDTLIKEGFITASGGPGEKLNKVEGKILKIGETDVYSFEGIKDYGFTYMYNEERMFYIWKKDNIYYMLLCDKGINNKQQILRQLISQ